MTNLSAARAILLLRATLRPGIARILSLTMHFARSGLRAYLVCMDAQQNFQRQQAMLPRARRQFARSVCQQRLHSATYNAM